MADIYFNRYYNFLIEGRQTVVPYVKIAQKPSDITTFYKVGVTRLDKVSQEFYQTPFFGWLILSANPEFGGLEWNIPDNAVIRVPFPLVQSVQDYEAALKTHFYYYGR